MTDSPVNILLVDDNPAKRLALMAALEPLGQHVVQAESGRDALRLLLQHEYAVILLDVRMPDMDGFETAALIRSRKQTETTPIIFVTAYERAEADMLDGYALGAVDYIFAPVVPEVLRAKVAVFVDLYKKTEAIKQHEQRQRELEARQARKTHEKLRRENERVRKNAEQEMRKLSSALEQTADPVFIVNVSGLIEYVNSAFERVTGYRRDEVIGARPNLLHAEGHPESFPTHALRQLAEGHVHRAEVTQRRKDGTLFVEERTITPVKDEQGVVTHFVSSGRDVTERKRVEAHIRQLNATLEERVRDRTAQLEDLNRELEAFAYSVSHDLRAPLRHMSSFTSLLRRETAGNTSDKARRYLDIIGQSAERMDTLINDLLAFSRTGRQDLHIGPVNLEVLSQEVWRDLSRECEGREVHFSAAPLPVVMADLATLRQVLVNLLANALKYTRPRARAVIEVGYRAQDGEHVLFVRDNGVGFNPAYSSKLFGVFQRLHKEGEFEGTGIGLANVRRIIGKHGGRTWAEGELDRGATFYFSLPGRPAPRPGPETALPDEPSAVNS